MLWIGAVLIAVASASLDRRVLDDRLEWRSVPSAHIGRRVRSLLATSYVATADGALRIEPTARMLRWVLEAPEADERLRVGLGMRGDDELVGFVCAVPCQFALEGRAGGDVEVSLLCLRHDLRGRGITRLLLDELRRRAAVCGVGRAIYTSPVPRGVPLACADCFHRPLRARALIGAGFWGPRASALGDAADAPLSRQRCERALVAEAEASIRLPHPSRSRRASSPRLRRMRAADVDEGRSLLDERSERFSLAPRLSVAQFRHRFLGGIARSYVLREPRGRLLGFVSFALLPLRAASGERLVQAQLLGLAITPDADVDAAVSLLLERAMRAARGMGAHVFNAHGLAELTAPRLARLGFERGDGVTFVHLASAGGDERCVLDRVLPQEAVCWVPGLI
jgi:GNAT superfamily N-acetyltransferase